MKRKLLLKEDVENLGKTGDVVDVAAGYARNYLLPRDLATEINASAMQEIEALKKRKAIRDLELKREFTEYAERIDGMEITIPMRVTQKGSLYGAVHEAEIADALAAKGISIEQKMVKLDEPVKVMGAHSVTLQLHAEVSATITVNVITAEGEPVMVEDEDDDDDGYGKQVSDEEQAEAVEVAENVDEAGDADAAETEKPEA